MHAGTLIPHLAGVIALGRGIFVWLIFRTLAHTIGWPATIAIVAVAAIGAMYARQRR